MDGRVASHRHNNRSMRIDDTSGGQNLYSYITLADLLHPFIVSPLLNNSFAHAIPCYPLYFLWSKLCITGLCVRGYGIICDTSAKAVAHAGPNGMLGKWKR